MANHNRTLSNAMAPVIFWPLLAFITPQVSGISKLQENYFCVDSITGYSSDTIMTTINTPGALLHGMAQLPFTPHDVNSLEHSLGTRY